MADEPLIPSHGGYRRLKSFQLAQMVYDVTVRFCDRYVEKCSRTYDQMIQAARSGVQNIVEGSQASGTSRKMEMKLTNVARASLEELRMDYEDFLRHRHLPIGDREDSHRAELIERRCKNAGDVAQWVRELHDRGGRSGLSGHGETTVSSTPSTPSIYPEIAANAALTLIAVASGLLDRQLKAQARAFAEEGGFTERLYRMRSQRRQDKK